MITEALVPTRDNAERAAHILIEQYGVGAVLLYGSVAEGTAEEDSDLDMVAIYDDLDYRSRFDLTIELAKTGNYIRDTTI